MTQNDSVSIESAKELLRQVVYKSRETGPGNPLIPSRAGLCGLGEKSPVFRGLPSELSPMVSRLFPDRKTDQWERVSDIFQSWLTAQDKWNRERNHFLKKFRQEHGFERRRYDATVDKKFQDGVDAINAEEERHLTDHARRLGALTDETNA